MKELDVSSFDQSRLERIAKLADKALWFHSHFWDLADGSGAMVSVESLEKFDEVMENLGVELGRLVRLDNEG